MGINMTRQELPQQVLSFLPLCLFVPIGMTYVGIVLFILTWLLSGNFKSKWDNVQQHPMLLPVLALSLMVCWTSLSLPRSPDHFWSGFARYQTYLFLILFVSVGGGDWQGRAMKIFGYASIYGATIYDLGALGVLPEINLFRTYFIPSGNNNTITGIVLAIAAAWWLHLALSSQGKICLKKLAVFGYAAFPILFIAHTRSGVLTLCLLCGWVLFRSAALKGRRWATIAVLALAAIVVWSTSSIVKERTMTSIEHTRQFLSGEKTGEPRLEMIERTLVMIAEKPWTGHGIYMWQAQFPERGKGLEYAQGIATPHSDYILFAAEMGVFSVLILLGIFFTQYKISRQLDQDGRAFLGLVTLAMLMNAATSPLLRDARFGLAFMILLAIPLAGARRDKKLIG
jgi:O-antigen ligase